jgi:serine/threonine protein kinase
MGNCNLKSAGDGDSQLAMQKSNFTLQYALGRGGFGKVWRVVHKKTKVQFAMKEMAKARIITKKSVASVMKELHYLESIQSQFIVNMHFAFQDKSNLYLIMDLLLGGDLRYHISRRRKFNEPVTKFFIACLIHALESVHQAGVVHRDVKPENLVFDNTGYLRLTDFGVACKISADNSSETSGTPGYMSPEVMCRKDHGAPADFFAVGVIGYECMLGQRPYQGKSRREIREQILAFQQ